MFGLTEDEAHPDVEIWSDNVGTLQCFIGLSTQWRSGMNGVTGLDYAAVSVVIEMNEVLDKKAVFNELQAMEMEVLRVMRTTSSYVHPCTT